jgi:small-conductance mechanosensitive channel
MKRNLLSYSFGVIALILLFLLAACSAATESSEATPTPTSDGPGVIGPVGDSESGDSSGFSGSIETPEPTATPGPLTRQISQLAAETGLDDAVFLGLSVEDWINLVISLLFVLIGYALGTWLVRGLARWVVRQTSSEFGNSLVEEIGDFVRWLVVLLSLQFATARLGFLSAEVKDLLANIYFILAWILLLRISWRLINLGIQQAAERLTHRGRGDEITPVIKLLEYTAKVLVGLVFIGFLLAHFGFNLVAFVAALGIGGLALSLALKDTIANFISGVIILIDQPFRVNDRIYVPGVDTWADVVEIGLRSTKVLTRDNRYIIFPNGIITNAEIVNYTYPDPSYRLQLDVSIANGTDIETVRSLLMNTVRNVEGIYEEKPVEVFYNEMGDSGMIFRVRWWIETYKEKRRIIDKVNTAVQHALDEAGIESPYPTQSLFHHLDPESFEQLSRASGENDQTST